MNTTRIFIASSAELEQDRKEFREFLSVENDRLHKKEVYLELVQWEHFLDSVSQTSLQDEYNTELKKSQIVICLFYTKAGKYTRQEFDVALTQFNETGSPIIYTYFKTGAPEPDPANQQAMDLVAFKKRLGDIGHFYTSYKSIEDLQLQFRKQLDRLEDKGIIKLQEEVKQETKEAVTNYINNINTATVQGSDNIVIQGVTNSMITVNVGGKTEEIMNELGAMKALLEKMAVKSFQAGDKVYDIEGISDANFAFTMGRSAQNKSLPGDLLDNLITDRNKWVQSLQQELKKKGVSVTDKPFTIFQHFGWLIEACLQKVETPSGQENTLRRLSFLAEAYQSSLRFLCFVQLSQVFLLEKKAAHPAISEFIKLDSSQVPTFDYSNLLLVATDQLKGSETFMPEIASFVEEFSDVESDLYGTNLFLENNRNRLIKKQIPEDDQLPALLDEYLTALVYWLRKLCFIAQYKMVSIKDIKLDYRVGNTVRFEHVYGELNGIFSDGSAENEESSRKSIEGIYTFNQSILLLKGKNVDSSLDNIGEPGNYISLSPLLIDQSVFSDVPKQTPEIFYYAGQDANGRQYAYAHYKNELPTGKDDKLASNKEMMVKNQNINQPALDTLYEQLEEILKPFKIRDK